MFEIIPDDDDNTFNLNDKDDDAITNPESATTAAPTIPQKNEETSLEEEDVRLPLRSEFSDSDENEGQSSGSGETPGGLFQAVPSLSDDEVIADLEAMLAADEAVIAASSSLMEAEYHLAQFEAEREAARLEFDRVAEERKAAEKALNAIIAREQELRNKAQQMRARDWQYEDKKKQAEKAKRIAEDLVRVKYENRRKQGSYLDIAATKIWWTGATMPDGQVFKIKDKQFIGSQFLADAERCILGDGMGTGKSITAIAAMDLVESKRTLIIAQADITNNFDDEVRMWAPHRVVVNIKGMSKEQRNAMLSMLNDHTPEFTLIVNFEAWRKDLTLIENIISMGFDTVIVDEAHNIKDTASIAYRGIKQIAHADNVCPKCRVIMPAMIDVNGRPLKNGMRMCVGCGWNGESFDLAEAATLNRVEDEDKKFWWTKSVRNIWALTGTPILNKPQDLYALLSITDPRNFDNKNQFLRQYCKQNIYTGKWGFQEGGADRLFRVRLKGKYLARTMEEMGIILPPQFPTVHDIEFDTDLYPKQWEVIQQITNSAEIVMSSGKALPILAQIAIITRQRQANVWPGGIQWTEKDPNTGVETIIRVAEEVTESIKIDKAIDIIKESVERGERVVLFSQFKTALAELEKRVNATEMDNGEFITAVRFDGSTDDATKAAIKRNFDKKHAEPKKWDVVLANYKVGGTGLNYTQAQRTIILDEEWNPGKRNQAYARTRRIGQDETTFVDILRLGKTVDTWLMKLIQEKEDMINGFEESAADMQSAWLEAFQKGELGAA